MGGGTSKASAPIRIDSNQLKQFQVSQREADPQSSLSMLKESAIQALYGKFVYLCMSSLADKVRQEAAMKEMQSKGIVAVAMSPDYTIELERIRELQEFRFHPFIERIITLLVLDNKGKPTASFNEFEKLMSVFCCETLPEAKRQLLFRVYDKQGTQQIPMLTIRSILTDELFVRSHYSEVQPGIQVKSSYSDRIMRDIMDDVMVKFDSDANKTIDY